jgi:hypothetical protein
MLFLPGPVLMMTLFLVIMIVPVIIPARPIG